MGPFGRLLRYLAGTEAAPATRMSQSDVLSAARAAAEQAGGGWSEQVGVRAFREQGRVLWSVTTHAHLRGGNTRVSIDDATGEVVEVRVLPR